MFQNYLLTRWPLKYTKKTRVKHKKVWEIYLPQIQLLRLLSSFFITILKLIIKAVPKLLCPQDAWTHIFYFFVRVLGRGKRVLRTRCVSSRVFIADLSTISHLNANNNAHSTIHNSHKFLSHLCLQVIAFSWPSYPFLRHLRAFRHISGKSSAKEQVWHYDLRRTLNDTSASHFKP